MANGKVAMGLVLLVVNILWAGGAAQSDCTNVLISMSPCLNYITGNSSIPSSQCCSQLANVVRSSPQCLCQVLNGGGSSLGINVNQTQALALPGACNVQTPPTSSCNSASPADSPGETPDSPSTIPSAASPADSPGETPDSPSTIPSAASPADSPGETPDSPSTIPSAASPADSPGETPDSPSTIPSGSGSKTVPSTQGDGSSDGSSIKFSLSLLTFLLFAASYASVFTTY